MKLKKLLEGLDVKIDPRLSDVDITCISTNSKDVKKGSLFIAINGFKFDGHKFLNEAFKNGAKAALVEKRKGVPSGKGSLIQVRDTREALSIAAKNFYRWPSEKLKVIGVTGTNGKTTTSLLIKSIFSKSRIPCGVIGTIDYETGKRRIPAHITTPDALGINALLDKMLKNKLKAVAMEVSSHALDQKRVEGIFFDAAVFTNLTHEHLDYHGNLERYFRSKRKIFSSLKKNGVAIINADDKNVRRVKKTINGKCITYGLNSPADINAKVKKAGLDGSSFLVRVDKKDAFSVNTKLIGTHNISNILAAIATGVSQGISLRAIKEGVEKLDSVKGRLEAVEVGQGFKVFIDYAHTHNALENVLKFLSEIKKGNIITVFGCGGDRDKKKRPLMGRVAEAFSKFVIITSDNPRNEDPKKIARDIEKGMNKANTNYSIVLNRKKAIEKALKKAKRGDIVLIAGKGHEKVQIARGRKIPFNDRKVAEELLRKI